MKRGLLACVALLAAGLIEAQVVTEMTPERIREAIADTNTKGCYPLKSSGKWLHGEDSGCFSTPYSRVAQAARSAREKYQTFKEADATPEMLAPVVEIVAFSPSSFIMGRGRVGPPLDLEAVVVMPRKSKDRAAAILPTVQTDVDQAYQNLLGARFEAKAIRASFPLTVLSEENEIRFVYAGKGCSDWKNKLSSECAVPFKLQGVK